MAVRPARGSSPPFLDRLKRSQNGYWQSARALAVQAPKPLATMLRMTEQT
jgi:hypothetical protein